MSVTDASLTTASASTDAVQCMDGAVFIRGTISAGSVFLDANPIDAAVNYIDYAFQANDLPFTDDDSAKCVVHPFNAEVLLNRKFRTSSDFVGSVTVSIVPRPQDRSR